MLFNFHKVAIPSFETLVAKAKKGYCILEDKHGNNKLYGASSIDRRIHRYINKKELDGVFMVDDRVVVFKEARAKEGSRARLIENRISAAYGVKEILLDKLDFLYKKVKLRKIYTLHVYMKNTNPSTESTYIEHATNRILAIINDIACKYKGKRKKENLDLAEDIYNILTAGEELKYASLYKHEKEHEDPISMAVLALKNIGRLIDKKNAIMLNDKSRWEQYVVLPHNYDSYILKKGAQHEAYTLACITN